MMRSLWTAASGMTTQQLNIDTISNNLANVNTVGYKKESLEFKSLLYQTMQRAGDTANNQGSSPVNLQVGLGVRPVATARSFTQGAFQTTNSPTDFTINGDGFFVIDIGEGDEQSLAYTRDGSFKLSVEDDGLVLVTSEGYRVLDVDEEPIVIPDDVMADKVTINKDGTFSYVDENGEVQDLGYQFDIVQFSNRQGLEAIGANLFIQTGASGEPMHESEGDVNKLSEVVQNSVEMSNVQVAEEMVKLIVAQRAYEINSKAITTSDEMLSQANQLKRS